MNPWLDVVGVVFLTVIGLLLGRWFAKLPKPYWMIGYAIPAAVVFLIWLGRQYSGLEFIPPISWLIAGRTKFAICGLLAMMILVVPLARVTNTRLRRLVWIFAVIFIADAAVWPFAACALNRDLLLGLKTRIDSNGVCRQGTDYTCGPAAAVTALRQFGVAAEEGELAVQAHTSQAIGTPPEILASMLRRRCEGTELVCGYRHFRDLAELRQAGVTIAVIKFGLLVDHYVTVLQITDDRVIVGDPLLGRVEYSHAQFEEKWRRLGIVLHRRSIN
jgi:hypothetical protein